jgi:phosphopantetheine adenylyltransferase
VKEVFRLGGDVARLVPPVVLESLKKRLPVTGSG